MIHCRCDCQVLACSAQQYTHCIVTEIYTEDLVSRIVVYPFIAQMTPFFRILTFIPFNRQINPSTKIILNFVINKKIIIPNFRVLKYFGMLLRIRIAKNSFLLLHDVLQI